MLFAIFRQGQGCTPQHHDLRWHGGIRRKSKKRGGCPNAHGNALTSIVTWFTARASCTRSVARCPPLASSSKGSGGRVAAAEASPPPLLPPASGDAGCVSCSGDGGVPFMLPAGGWIALVLSQIAKPLCMSWGGRRVKGIYG